MRIQPDEAVYLKMNSKLPGFATRAVPAELDLTYEKRFEDARIPQAYEALILDAFKGDHSNFVRDDELDVAWKIFTPILHWIDGKDCKFRRGLADGQRATSPSLLITHTDREVQLVSTSLPPSTGILEMTRISESSIVIANSSHWPKTKVDQQSNL